MDYRKAIETHVNECRHRIDVIREHMNTNGDADTYSCFENIKVLETAISALKELQAIHNNGISIERLKDIDFRKQVVEHINYMEYMDIKDELEEYKQIGTLEEVREAVDRNKAKKPEKGKPYKWIDSVRVNGRYKNVQKTSYGHACTNCGKRVLRDANFCSWCGQHIDWSDEND